MKRLLLIVLLFLPTAAFAQSKDTVAPARPVAQRPLPPSIIAELHRSDRNRTLVYHDTVHASDIERAHAADTATAAGTYADSAITLFDTAVSLSHKEWLDSALVEIPELQRVGSHIHFNYPSAIMTESEMTQVPFDSTILLRMNPVTREVLPFFDQSPIPMPLPSAKPFEAFLEGGAGANYAPFVQGFFEQAFTPRLALSARTKYESRPSLPINSFFDIQSTLHASTGSDAATDANHISDVGATLGYLTRNITLLADSVKSRAMSLFNIGADIDGFADDLHYTATLKDRQWNEDAFTNSSESVQDITGSLDSKLGNEYALYADGNYSVASLTDSASINAGRIALRFGTQHTATLAWSAGIALLGGAGAEQSIAPVAHARLALNPRWELGLDLDPHAQLSTMTSLTATNPFYTHLTGRGGVVDKLNLSAFMTYALSLDDALRIEADYITRDGEPVFEPTFVNDSIPSTTALTASTRRFSLGASGNFLLFQRDILTASVTLMSAMNVDSSKTMPFEPALRFDASYRLKSLSDIVQPLVRFRSLTFENRSLAMLDLEVSAQIWRTVSAKLAIENVLNGASDFWPGYQEMPRSVLVTLRYGF